MRTIAWTVFILLASAACDKEGRKNDLPDATAPNATQPVIPMASSPRSETEEAGVSPPARSVAMPERPIPKPGTMVSASAPEETQLKAIGYMVAMRTPHPDDAPVDEAYAADLVEKLKPVVRAMDKGADKAKWNRVDMIGKGRQIDLYLSDGCDAKAPLGAVTQRLGIPLSTLRTRGVLVVRCNDTKHQCLQSTRDSDDVLCTTAPRHK